MYNKWVDQVVYVNLYHGRFVAQKKELEKKIGILQKMAEDLIDDGIFNFQEQNTFPKGRNHFSQLIQALARISNFNNEQSIFSISLRKNLGDDVNGKTNFGIRRAEE